MVQKAKRDVSEWLCESYTLQLEPNIFNALKSKYWEYEISMIFSRFTFSKEITSDEQIFTGNFN